MTHTIITPRKTLSFADLRELWDARELLAFFSWRDLTVRYKQTSLGVLWAFIRPFLAMVIFTIIFGKIAKLPSDGIPYPLITFAALTPWQFFATAFSDVSNSIVGNGHMISKIYFPRLAIPLSAVVVAGADFLVNLLFLILLMIWYGATPGISLLFLPVALLLCVIGSLGAGLWFAALFVKYRDVRHLVPFVVQFGMYVSPVAYSTSVIPEKWRLLYSLNPMVGVIDAFRWSLLGRPPIYLPGLFISAATAVVLLLTGYFYFKRTEPLFADII